MSTKQIWLLMLREGGRWSIGETIEAAGLRAAKQTVPMMASTGSLVRFEKEKKGDRIRYGVTKNCKVPTGVTLAELMEVGVVKEVASES